MKRILIILALVAAAVPAFSQSAMLTDSLYSQVLGTHVKYNVYLPDGFQDSGQRYPVVYLLHGLTDTYEAWEQKGRMKAVADLLTASGEIVPMVIIMPNAGGPDLRNQWNGYFNMPGWPYEDFFFGELMPQLEEKYRCIGNKEHRAVMGLSMGGGGSTSYAQRHPELFSSCYAMSAWLDNDNSEVGPTEGASRFALVCRSVHENSCLEFLRRADENTLSRLRTVSWFFDCGDDDFLFDLSVEIHRLMRRLAVPDQLRIRDGVHNWEYWHSALYTALPFASRNFSR